MASGTISEQLSALRRYAGFLTGSDADGDTLVTAMLRRVLEGEVTLDAQAGLRIALFRALHDVWVPSAATDEEGRRGHGTFPPRMSPLERAALSLVRLEGFFAREAAYVLRMDVGEVERRLDRAERKLENALPRRILIVEDDLVLGMNLQELVASLGHRPIGPIATGGEAVRIAMREKPALILSDIKLRDGISGIEAVREIRHAMDIPVIYVTGFPHRLHDRRLEPASYVVPKPYSDSLMKSFITSTLLRHGLAG